MADESLHQEVNPLAGPQTAQPVATPASVVAPTPAPAPVPDNNPFAAGPVGGDDDFSFDATGVQEGYRIEKGVYPARVIDLVKKNSSAGNPMWEWNFVLTGPKYAGREFKTWTVLTPQASWKVAEVLSALGLGKAGEVIKFTRNDVLNKPVLLTIEDDTYNGVAQSKVGKVLPWKDSAPAGSPV